MEHNNNIDHPEEKGDKRFLYISLGVHVLLFLLLILVPLFSYTFPIPQQEGVQISFGNPDVGSGSDRPDVQDKERVTPQEASKPKQPQIEEVAATKSTPKTSTTAKSVVTQEELAAISFEKKKKEAEATALKEAKRIEDQAKREAIAEAKRQAEVERQKAVAAALKDAEYRKKKKQFGDFLGGSGKGSTASAGNQGNPNGNPDANALSGISKGSGKVGGGLSNRGVVSEPTIQENSQKKGRVVLKVCVDHTGRINKAEYTQRGSTTTDTDLVRIAKENAVKWRFNASTITQQCGTITIDFKLQ